MYKESTVNVYEEEFLRGDQKPCWCCANNLKTAALIVAVAILYSHCVVAFILLTFYVIDYDDQETLEESESYRLSLLIGTTASFAYIPLAFALLIGIVKNRLWLVIIWWWTIVVITFLDCAMFIVDQTMELVIFMACFLLIRFYFLYVIWAYIAVAKKQRKLQQAWENIEKSVNESVISVVTEKGEGDEDGLEGGDSRLELGDVDKDDDLSHDSVMEKIRESEIHISQRENERKGRVPNIKFKSLGQ